MQKTTGNETVLYWDPFDELLNCDSFIDKEKSLITKLKFFSRFPGLVSGIFIILLCLPIAYLIFYLYYQPVINKYISFVIYLSIPIFMYYSYIRGLQHKLITYVLCEKNNWLFNHGEDKNRTKKLIVDLPEIFDIGHDRSIENQIWGNIFIDEKIDFWQANFKYETGSGKTRRHHSKTVFAIKLKKELNTAFILNKTGLFSQHKNTFKTESHDFNKFFQIDLLQDNDNTRIQVMKILSPSVQIRLINLANQIRIDSVYFNNKYILFVFADEIFHQKYMNFFSRIRIDNRDQTLFMGTLTILAQIPAEIIDFID